MIGLNQRGVEVNDSDAAGVPEKQCQRSVSEKQRTVEASFKPSVGGSGREGARSASGAVV